MEAYRDLTVDFCRRIDAQFIIKGVRTLKDFEYEQEMADINRQLSGVETILFLAAPELSHISSSMVRELAHFGKDITEFLPNDKG